MQSAKDKAKHRLEMNYTTRMTSASDNFFGLYRNIGPTLY